MTYSVDDFFKNAADAMFIAEKASGIILDANKAASRLLQLPHEKIVGIHQSRLHPTNDASSFNKHLEEIEEVDLTAPHESKVKCSDGSEILVEIMAFQINFDGKQCIMGIFRDISLRKQTDEKIKDSEANLNSLINNRDESIWSIDTNYNYIIFNDFFKEAYFAAFNIELKEGLNVFTALPVPELKTFWKQNYDKALSGNKVNFEYSNQVGDLLHYYEVFLNPIILDDKIVGVSGISVDITERKLSEQALKRSEEKYKNDFSLLSTIMDSPIDIIVFALDLNYCYTAFSEFHKKTIKHIWGVEIEIGMNMLDVISDKVDNDKAKKNFDRALQGDYFLLTEEYGDEKLHRTFYENYYNCIKNSEGNIIGLSVFVIDVTKRKNAEHALKEREAMLREVQSIGHLGSYEIGISSTYIKWSDETFRIFNMDSSKNSEPTLEEYFKFIHPEDSELVFKHFEESIKTKKEFNLEYRIITLDGKIKYVHSLGKISVDHEGRVLNMLGTFQDITDRKKTEQALQESEEKLRLLIKNSNDIFVLINENGEQFFISDVVESITGYATEELYGPITTAIHPQDLDLVSQNWKEVLSNSNKSFRVQYRHKHKENGFVWLDAIAQNFLQNPSIRAVVANIRDITANKKNELDLTQRERQLKELNATKDKLFSIIAHDLKSPFNSILGFSELLKENIKNYNIEKSVEFATIINTSAKKNLLLLNNLLTWAKTQTGQIEFKPENLKLHPIVEGIFLGLNSTASLKNMKLISSLSDDIVAYADQNMLLTILRNLVQNAIKFTNSGGKVYVSAVSKQNHIEISVTDNGVGINEENQKKLFGADVNFTLAGTENESGSGLGLMLCKEFVEKHQGKIWVESEVGKGSKFIFTLPELPIFS